MYELDRIPYPFRRKSEGWKLSAESTYEVIYTLRSKCVVSRPALNAQGFLFFRIFLSYNSFNIITKVNKNIYFIDRVKTLAKKLLTLFLVAIASVIFLTGCVKTTPAAGDGNLRVTVFGVDHKPLPGAKVVSNSQPDGQLKLTGLTDSDGIVWFQNIKTSNYDFYISRFDYNQTQFSVTINPGQTTEMPVYLELANPGSTTTPTTSSPVITFSQLTADPEKYNGQTVTIEGFWFDGFEIEVLAERLISSDFAPGNLQPDGLKIWVKNGLPEGVNQQLYLQANNPTGYPAHYGKVELTGILEYGGQYGQMNSYQYQVTAQSAKLIPWNP